MRKLSLLLFAAAVFLCVFGVAPARAKADGLTVYNLGGDNVHLLGIDAGGTVLISQFSGCGGPSDPNYCFEEFTGGVMTYKSDAAPTNFVAQNGTPCAAPGALAAAGASVCNGTWQVAGGRLNGFPGVWENSDGSAILGTLAYEGSADVLDLNNVGDFAALDGLNSTLVEVVATTPEPSSLILLATGALGMGEALRRKRQAR